MQIQRECCKFRSSFSLEPTCAYRGERCVAVPQEMRPSLLQAVQDAPAQQNMAETIASVARRVDEHEEDLGAYELGTWRFDERITELQYAVDAQQQVLEDFRMRFAALARGLAFGRAAASQSAPLALVALQRQQAVADEIRLLRSEVTALRTATTELSAPTVKER